jgi:hypothetical protein
VEAFSRCSSPETAHTISQDAPGNILVDGLKTTTSPTCTTSLDATIANTTQIGINGTPGARTDDAVTILTYKPSPDIGATANWGRSTGP